MKTLETQLRGGDIATNPHLHSLMRLVIGMTEDLLEEASDHRSDPEEREEWLKTATTLLGAAMIADSIERSRIPGAWRQGRAYQEES